MQLFANPNRPEDAVNCAEFQRFMARFPWANFYQPNSVKAPWHVQCLIPTETGDTITLNFWPHKLKGNCEMPGGYRSKAVEGLDELRGLMAQAIDDSQDEIELIE